MANTPTLQRAPGNNASDTISGGINAADLTIPLNSASEFSNDGGKIVIDRGTTSEEYVYYESKSGNTLTVATDGRGQEGTADQSHNDGATVDAVPTADQWNNMLDAVVDEDSAQTITGAKTFTTGLLKAIDATSGAGVSTFPTVSDTLVGKATTDVLTNKTIVQKVTSYTPDAAGTATLDLTTGNIHRITCPAGNFTIAVSNEAVGQCFTIEIIKDNSATARTITWMDTVTWITSGGTEPTFTTTANGMTTYGFRVTAADAYEGYLVGSK